MQFTILGSHPDISLAEIHILTGAEPTMHHERVGLFDDIDVELSKLNDRLGGVQKLGHIIGTVAAKDIEDIMYLMSETLLALGTKGKIRFGISLRDMREGGNDLEDTVHRLGIAVKRQLQDRGRSARLVTGKEPHLSSVIVNKNRLLEDGAEFVLIVTDDKTLIGQTSAVQDVDDWAKRDMGRPARDARRGMLPPKLARIMVNLAGKDTDGKTLLDPFCGSGTVLMEAALVGYGELLGTDASEQAVEDTRENLAWMEQEGYTLPKYGLLQSSAAHLSGHLDNESIDAVVTEPYLGKPRRGDETKREVKNMLEELAGIYRKSFETLFEKLKTGGTLVLASPVHFVSGEPIAVPSVDILKTIGFTHEPFTTPLLYRQKGQFVGRELLRFGKNN